MAMTYDEWKHRMANYGYIEDARQHNTEKRLLEAIGRQRGWIKTPVPKPDWFTRKCALARQLVSGYDIKALNGNVILAFTDLETKVLEDRVYLPVAIRYARKPEDHRQAASWLRDGMVACAMDLIESFRPSLDPDWQPEDEAFFEHITQGEVA